MWHGSLVGAPGQWRDEQFSRGGSPDGVCAAAIGGRVASGAASGAVCGGGGRKFRPESDDGRVSWFGFGVVPSGGVAGDPGLWLRERGVFEPQAGAGDVRFGGCALCRGKPASRSRHDRHVPTALCEADRRPVVQVLLLAREIGMLKMGTVALDGTKIHANASRHSALSYEHAGKIEAQLKAEVSELMAKAEAADRAGLPDGLSIPDELARRADRLTKLAAARAKIEARAKERLAHEQAEYQAKLAAREAKAEKTGKKPRGKPPEPPAAGPRPTDQINLTDEESRIMPVAGGGFDQCYNAQAAVAADSLLVVASDVVQAANDKQQIEPMLDKLHALPAELGIPTILLADHGYFSAANVTACRSARIEPLIAAGRQSHHPSLSDRFAQPLPAPDNPTPVVAMLHRLATSEGKRLYALRKQIPEPVFGIMKSALGFRQFLLRGLDKVGGEWNLVIIAWNMKRMFALHTR